VREFGGGWGIAVISERQLRFLGFMVHRSGQLPFLERFHVGYTA
jgi:hypothetical protein